MYLFFLSRPLLQIPSLLCFPRFSFSYALNVVNAIDAVLPNVTVVSILKDIGSANAGSKWANNCISVDITVQFLTTSLLNCFLS